MKYEHECNKKLDYFRFFIEQKQILTNHQMLAKVFCCHTYLKSGQPALFPFQIETRNTTADIWCLVFSCQ